MKTKQRITVVLSMFTIFCLALFFTGCSSDDDGDREGETTVAYRVAESVSTEISGSNIYEDKSIYNYLDERLIEIIELDKENGLWMEDRKTEFEYEGDWVYSTRYYKEGGGWIEQNMQSSEQLKIVNGKVVEIKYSSMNYVSLEVFTYSGDKLIEIERFVNGELNDKYVFTYNGDNLNNVIEYYYNYGIEEMDSKYEFYYVNGQLTELLGFYFDNGVWESYDKNVYFYSGNKVIQIDDYDYYNDSWELDDSEFYGYNSEGLLESISESGEGWTEEEIYTYEEGIGNYRLLQGDGGYYDIFNYPTAQRGADAKVIPDERKFNLKRFLFR